MAVIEGLNFRGFKHLFRETAGVSVYFFQKDTLRTLQMIFLKWLKEKKKVKKKKQILDKTAYTVRRSRAIKIPSESDNHCTNTLVDT